MWAVERKRERERERERRVNQKTRGDMNGEYDRGKETKPVCACVSASMCELESEC